MLSYFLVLDIEEARIQGIFEYKYHLLLLFLCKNCVFYHAYINSLCCFGPNFKIYFWYTSQCSISPKFGQKSISDDSTNFKYVWSYKNTYKFKKNNCMNMPGIEPGNSIFIWRKMLIKYIKKNFLKTTLIFECTKGENTFFSWHSKNFRIYLNE